jgi:hypothetical protein
MLPYHKRLIFLAIKENLTKDLVRDNTKPPKLRVIKGNKK